MVFDMIGAGTSTGKGNMQLGLRASLVLYVFTIMVAALALSVFAMTILNLTGAIDFDVPRPPPEQIDEFEGFRGLGIFGLFRSLLTMFIISSVFGFILSALLSKRTLRPIEKLIDATREIAGGDFSVRVEPHGLRELEELAVSFNKMAQELSSIETLRSDFTNNFSHEFKTPIVSIRGFAKLLESGNLTDEEKQEYLSIIITESERLSELSTSVLNLSKYESIEIVTEKEPFRVDEQIRRAILLTEPKWSKKNLDINIDMDEIVFNGNEHLTQQIWINLLDNAIKFTQDEGTINVRLSDLGKSIRFSIEDNGIGMDEKTRLRIFDKFYQGDNSHNLPGNGLGLPMVKRIVELHGGLIEVDGTPGAGSIFIVILPK